MEWIVKSLRPGGRAFVIVPDGILARVGGKKLRNYLLRECFLDAIVSLPIRTFFANAERTYILAITKKQSSAEDQTDPVFTYIASNIGERLSSVKREEIDLDDLPEMELLFHLFSSSKSKSKKIIETQSKRCKIQPIGLFRGDAHWVVDRWWTHQERVVAGAIDAVVDVTSAEVAGTLEDLKTALAEFDDLLETVSHSTTSERHVQLGDDKYFKLSIGKRLLAKNVAKEPAGDRKVPAYSANVSVPFGFVAKSNTSTFENPSILWGIDGNFNFALLPAKTAFAYTDHCGRLEILGKDILPEFVFAAVHFRRMVESFDRSFRASLTNMRLFTIAVPTTGSGDLDIKAQAMMAERFKSLEDKREIILGLKKKYDSLFSNFMLRRS